MIGKTRGRVVWVAAVVALAAACADSTDLAVDDIGRTVVEAPVEVALDAGQEVTLPGTVVRVAFLRVPEDSRCPVDVVCVWEGNAVVEIGVTVGSGPTVPIQLNTALEPRSVRSGAHDFAVVSLDPVQRSGSAIEPGEYRVRVRIAPI